MSTSTSKPKSQLSADAEFEAELRQSCLESAPAAIRVISQSLQRYARSPQDAAALQELHRKVHSLTGNAGLAGLRVIARVATALEGLLKELTEKPDRASPSVLRTIAQSVDLLAALYSSWSSQQNELLADAEALAVDDEELALRAVDYSLAKLDLKVETVQDPAAALKLLSERRFALIVSDIEMPGMKGTEFCTKLRTMPKHRVTPVVFVTNAADFGNRAQACLSGGNDLIAKPFLFTELAVKAVTMILRSRLKRS